MMFEEFSEVAEAALTVPYSQDDVGMVSRFIDKYDEDLCFVTQYNKWFYWDGKRLAQSIGQETEAMHVLLRQMHLEAAALFGVGNLKESLALERHVNKMGGRIPYLLGQASKQPEMRVDAAWLDSDPDELNGGNVLLHIPSGTASPTDYRYQVTKLLGAEYRTDATAPRWEQFLGEVLPDEEVQRYVQRLVGYTLMASRNERVVIFLHGVGRNGKSVLVETLSEVFGDYAVTVSNALLKKRKFEDANAASPALASLKGARMIVTSEFESDDQISTSFLKHVVGGEKVSARPMYGEPITFPVWGTFWISTNHMPNLGAGRAVWDRIRVVPFDVRIADDAVDPDLKSKLLKEAPGILNWALEGVQGYLKEGLREPNSLREATSAVRTDQDPLADFLAEWAEEGETFSVTTAELYEMYRSWALHAEGTALTKDAFGKALGDLGRFAPSKNVWNIEHTKRSRGWTGLKLVGTPSAAAAMTIFTATEAK